MHTWKCPHCREDLYEDPDEQILDELIEEAGEDANSGDSRYAASVDRLCPGCKRKVRITFYRITDYEVQTYRLNEAGQPVDEKGQVVEFALAPIPTPTTRYDSDGHIVDWRER